MSGQQHIQDTQSQVEGTLGDLESNFTNLDHSGIIRPLNQCIEKMNGLTVHYDALGSTRKREDVDLANGFVAKHNDILKRIESLSTRAKSKLPSRAPQPTRPPVGIVEETVELAPPNRSQQTQQQPVQQAQQPPVQTFKPLSAGARTALNEFSRLYAQYQNLQAIDVWTGRSNHLVQAWSSFCAAHAPALSSAVSAREGTSEDIQELRATINSFNTFASDLTAKIRSLQITDVQRRTIESFPTEHDRLISAFRACLPDLDRAGSYYEQIVDLENRLRALNIPDHPTVKAALDGILGTQNQMEEILHDISVRQSQALEEQMQQQVPAPATHAAQRTAEYTEEVEEFVLPAPQQQQQQQQPPQSTPVQQSSQPASQNVPKFCGECGTPTGGKRFCGECGYKFF